MYQKLSLEAVDEPGEALLGVLAAVHASMPRVVLYSEAAELAALASRRPTTPSAPRRSARATP